MNSDPSLTAIYEGAGALLWWNVATGESGADVWDAARADAWLSQPELGWHDLAQQAAYSRWRAAWWPASHLRAIAPLDPRLLAAQHAIALADLDGINDDEDAAARAFAQLAAEIRRLGPLPEGAPDCDRLESLADDYGVTLEDAGVQPRTDYALAASGVASRAGALAAGESAVDPGSVPAEMVDPFGTISWRLAADMSVEVSVPAAPVVGEAPAVALNAVVGGLEVPLYRTADVWTGVAEAATMLLLGTHEARLEVPGFDPIPGVAASMLVQAAERIGDGTR